MLAAAPPAMTPMQIREVVARAVEMFLLSAASLK